MRFWGTPVQRMVIELPVKLPTWNALLGMNRWKRAKVRHLIHELVLQSSRLDAGSPMPMELARKRQLMGSSIAAYYETIAPAKSRKLATSKSRSRTRRKKGHRS